jgi:hypothetical protein
MGTRYVISLVFIALTCASASYGWQTHPPGGAAEGAYPPAPQPVVSQQQYQGALQYGALSGSPPLYTPLPNQQGAPAQDGYPQYPYPQYHNPYYSSGSVNAKDLVLYATDWLFSLPSNIAERLSNIVDNRFFPQTPATHGGQPQSHIPGTQPSEVSPSVTQASPRVEIAPAGPSPGN